MRGGATSVIERVSRRRASAFRDTRPCFFASVLPQIGVRWVACFLAISCFGFAVCGCGGSSAEYPSTDFSKWPPADTSTVGTLGNALQTQFTKHAGACGCKANSAHRNYIPSNLAMFMRTPLTASVENIDISGKGLLTYAFSPAEIQSDFQSLAIQPNRLLKLEALGLPNLFFVSPEGEFPSILYRSSCGSFVSAAISGGLRPPYVALEASLKADAASSSSVVLVEGTFLSPVYDLLQRYDARANALRLKLWQLYTQDSSLESSAFYLRSFSGVMVSRVSNAELNRKLDSRFGGAIGAGIVDLKAEASARKEVTTLLEGTDLQTILCPAALTPERRRARYAPFPDGKAIRDAFSKIVPKIVVSSADRRLAQRKPFRLELEVPGIPSELASDGNWDLSIADEESLFQGKPEYHVQSVSSEDGPTARFSIKATPSDQLFGSQKASSVNLSYTIRSRTLVDGQSLEICTDVAIETTNHPTPLVLVAQPIPFATQGTGDNRFKVAWTFPVSFVDTENPVDYQAAPPIHSGNVSLALGGEAIETTATITADSVNRQFNVSIVGSKLLEYAKSDLGGARSGDCKAAFDIPLTSGGRAQLTISVGVTYPGTTAIAANTTK